MIEKQCPKCKKFNNAYAEVQICSECGHRASRWERLQFILWAGALVVLFAYVWGVFGGEL